MHRVELLAAMTQNSVLFKHVVLFVVLLWNWRVSRFVLSCPSVGTTFELLFVFHGCIG